MRKAEESRPRGRHLRSSSSRPAAAAASSTSTSELKWVVGAHQILDLNIHITGVQYIRIHPTGSRRPKTALLAVSRSMHWLCLHPHPPFASHSLTDSLTHQICSDPAANHQSARGAEGGCNPRPGLGRSHKANGGQKRDLVRRAREEERERERHRRSVDQVSGTFGWFTECSQPASQPAGLSLASAAAVVQECM